MKSTTATTPAGGPRQRQPSTAFALIHGLLNDARFRRLPIAQQVCLLHAAVRYPDGDGWFFPSEKRWAADAGTSDRTVRRAIAAARESGLLTVQIRLRQNGSQTSNRYRFDPRLSVRPDAGVADAGVQPRSEAITTPF